MRYLRGTSKYGLFFGGDKPLLVRYADADMTGDADTWRSTFGFVVAFTNGIVS